MSFLDYDPYYRCGVCKRKIHQARVPGSVTGDVKCCGQSMARPHDPTATLAALAALAAGATCWFATALGFWRSAAAAVLTFLIAGKLLSLLRDRLKKRDAPP